MNLIMGIKSQDILDAGVSCNKAAPNGPLITLLTFHAQVN